MKTKYALLLIGKDIVGPIIGGPLIGFSVPTPNDPRVNTCYLLTGIVLLIVSFFCLELVLKLHKSQRWPRHVRLNIFNS